MMHTYQVKATIDVDMVVIQKVTRFAKMLNCEVDCDGSMLFFNYKKKLISA